VFVLCRLERNAIHRAGNGAKMAGNAAFFAVRVAAENNAALVPGRKVRLLLRVLDGHPWLEHVQKYIPERSYNA